MTIWRWRRRNQNNNQEAYPVVKKGIDEEREGFQWHITQIGYHKEVQV